MTVLTWRRLVLVLLLVYILARLGMAGVETTTITGQVIVPNTAIVATAGYVTAQLSQEGQTPDGTVVYMIGGRMAFPIAADGTVTGFKLVPNDAISPSGRYYAVTFSVTAPARTSWTWKWNLATTPDPINVADVPRL